MARLMLSLDGQVLAEYNMNKERYTIGRLPDNEIASPVHGLTLAHASEHSIAAGGWPNL